MASKTLKAIKEAVTKQFDFLGASASTQDVEIVCNDKECLLKSVMDKIDEFVNGKETTANSNHDARAMGSIKKQSV